MSPADPAARLILELEGAELDMPLLRGFIGITPVLRSLELELDESTLIVSSQAPLSRDQVMEFLRVLGGSLAGDVAVRVISPGEYAGEVAIPHMQQGPARWNCPRCNREVMQGANDSGGINSICEPCWRTEMRLAGQPDARIDRSGLQNPSSHALLAARSASPGGNPEGHAEPAERVEPPPPEPSAAEQRSEVASSPLAVIAVASPADLPRNAPVGLIAVMPGRLFWSTSAGWFSVEGHSPPVQ